MGETLAAKLVANVADRRTLDLAIFLRALGINDLGRSASRWIADAFGSLAAVRAATADQIAAIHGLGELTANSILAGLEDRNAVIDALLEHVTVTDALAPVAGADENAGPWVGQKYLFTGALESMKRKEAQKHVQTLGGETPSGVQRDLTVLVVGDADFARFQAGWRSSKLKKAEGYNNDGSAIEIISEKDFLVRLDAAQKGDHA